jgi:hypothetical protein
VTALPDQVYPTLVQDTDATATGELLTDLTADEWHALDSFEHPAYLLASLQHPAGHAWAYTAATPPTPAPWSPDDFARQHLSAYLERCTAWRQRYDAAQSQNRSSGTAE